MKVRCIGYKEKERCFTVGKVYTLENGCITADNGFKYHDGMTEGADPKKWRLAKWYDFEVVNDQKIVITTDGKETLARLYDGEKVILSATAKCNPDDTFDFATGAKLAFERLMEAGKKKAPKFKVGDKVIGNEKANDNYGITGKGWIGYVIEIFEDGQIRVSEEATDKHGYTVDPDCFDKIEEKKFKPGDKVKIIANTCYHVGKVGEIVTLKNIYDTIRGETAWHMNEHSGWILERDIEPYVEEKASEPDHQFKVGQRYKYHDKRSDILKDGIIEITKANEKRASYKIISGLENDGADKCFETQSYFAGCLTLIEGITGFRVGDRVRAIAQVAWMNTAGKTGTVIGFINNEIAVEFDQNINGHNASFCGASGKDGHCAFCLPGQLERINERAFKVGDRVKCIGGDCEGKFGTVILDDGTSAAPFRVKFDDGILYWKYAKNLKRVEPPKYLNGKVVCVKSPYGWWTVGKVYDVVDGIIKSDCSRTYPRKDREPYRDYEDVRHAGHGDGPDDRHNEKNEFIPFKG